MLSSSKFNYIDRTNDTIISNSTLVDFICPNAATGNIVDFYEYDGTTGARPIFWEYKELTSRVVKGEKIVTLLLLSRNILMRPLSCCSSMLETKRIVSQQLHLSRGLRLKVSYVVDGKPLSVF
jgi:hypothetical protein